MILDNNILTPLPFYTDKKYQDRYKYYGFGDIFPLASPSDRLLPFQIITPNFSAPTITRTIVRVNADGSDGSETPITFYATGVNVGNYSIYHYDGSAIGSPLSEGRWYLKIRFVQGGTDMTFYSEVFTVVGSDMTKHLLLEWWNEETMTFDGGSIYYNGTTYKNKLYLPTTVGKPTYQFEEEGEERNGYFFAEKQISRKQYVFNFLAPEYLCDALRFLRMHDFVTVTENGITYEINQIETDVEWQTQGNLASVTVRFYCNTVAKAVGKMSPFLSGGDYNDDYNDDFNNE